MVASLFINRVIYITSVQEQSILIGDNTTRRNLILFIKGEKELGIFTFIRITFQRLDIIVHVIPNIVNIMRNVLIDVRYDVTE